MQSGAARGPSAEQWTSRLIQLAVHEREVAILTPGESRAVWSIVVQPRAVDYHARCLVADDGLMSMTCRKHGFQRLRSNFYGKFVRFNGYKA